MNGGKDGESHFFFLHLSSIDKWTESKSMRTSRQKACYV